MLLDDIDILLIAFGGDTFKNDPDAISIGRFSLDLSSYTEMGKTINKYFKNIPMMITQEGGYDMENIGQIVSLFISGLMDKQ
jgi:acetoin utilization deacetylase AcuC-like enzyme